MLAQTRYWALGAAIVTASACAVTTADAQTVLRMNSWLPPGHTQLVGTMQPWAEQVAEATDGRVKVELTAASLGAPPRQYDLAVDGIADITFGVLGYTPGRFKLASAAELPFVSDTGEALSVGLWRTYEKYFKQADEYKDVVLLAIYAHQPGKIMTTKAAGPVESLDDYAGKKFRVGGGIVQQLNPMLGGVNVAVPANDVYEVLSQGVADGTLLPTEAYNSFKLNGVITNETRIPGGLYSSVWFAVMNKDAFDRLSADDQAAIMSVSGESLARLGGRAFDDADTAAAATMEKDGVTRIVADDAFVAAIKEKTAPLEESWIADADSLGVDGAAALKFLREQASSVQAGG